jgi:CRISPR system Cascade subunit CasD
MMSWGGISVGRVNPTDQFPGRSALTGLFGNAMGYDRTDFDHLQRLQDSFDFACCAIPRVMSPHRVDGMTTHGDGPMIMRDFQTADTSTPWMSAGDMPRINKRMSDIEKLDNALFRYTHTRDGSEKSVTALRWRDYLMNERIVVAIRVRDAQLRLEQLRDALQRPCRPLFLGRKNCIPSSPVFGGMVEAASWEDALRLGVDVAMPDVGRGEMRLAALFPATSPEDLGARGVSTVKDWANGVHVGRDWIKPGVLTYARPIAEVDVRE